MSMFGPSSAEREVPVARLQVRFRWIALVTLLPFVALGVIVLLSSGYELIRYDPAYFTSAYREQYGEPAAVARALEDALQTGNERLLAELHGLRQPASLDTDRDLVFVMMLDRTDKYVTYLYFNNRTYERLSHHVTRVRGRWVVSPPDLHFYLQSGLWRQVFFPLAIAWWIAGFLAVGFVWLVRTSDRLRASLFGE
ncbi:MAG: hypothetical protein JXA93_18310 [Anaerolineae bacterium]|nr:hypothetical protein [Anaerolineae bacterium]